MARRPRIEYPGVFFHIIVRGNNRENVFRDHSDYVRYLQKFSFFCREGDITLYAYCLMPNHIHLLLEMGEVSLSKVLQRFHTWYTQYFNRRYGRVGHLFQGRYKAIVCDKDAYLLELVRYIHLNPVRAGLVDSPEEYPWSSHRVYLSIDKSEVIDPSFVLKQFSDRLSAARRSYETFVMEGSRQGRRDDLYKVSDQRVLGDEEFHKEVFRRRADDESDSPGMPTMYFELNELEEIMQNVMGFEPGSLRSGGRFGTSIRRVFCYIARTYGSCKGKDVAVHLGRDLATVTHGVRFVENLLHAGDQRTIDLINGIREEIVRKRLSLQDKKEGREKQKLKKQV